MRALFYVLTAKWLWAVLLTDKKTVAITDCCKLRSLDVTSSQLKSIKTTSPFQFVFSTSSTPVSSNMRNDYKILKRNRFNLELNVFLTFCANRLIISELRIWHVMHATDNGFKIDVINHGRDKESVGFRTDIQIAPWDPFAVVSTSIYLLP